MMNEDGERREEEREERKINILIEYK